MSIKSTHNVTREFAISAIVIKLHSCTNEQLGNMLEEAIHNGFYNFTIVDKIDDSDVYSKHLADLNNLPEYNDAY